MELAIYNAFRKAGVEEEEAKAIADNLNANFNTTVSKAIEQHYAVHSQQTASSVVSTASTVACKLAVC